MNLQHHINQQKKKFVGSILFFLLYFVVIPPFLCGPPATLEGPIRFPHHAVCMYLCMDRCMVVDRQQKDKPSLV